MNGQLNNIIRKQTVHFQYNGQADGFALQKEVGDWCSNELKPLLEHQLEVLCRPGIHLALDKIEIGAVAQEANWKEQVKLQLLKAINEKLLTMVVLISSGNVSDTSDLYNKPLPAGGDTKRKITIDQAGNFYHQEGTKESWPEFTTNAVSPEVKKKTPTEQKADELIIFFFVHGYLPWWSGSITTTGDFTQFFKEWVVMQKNKARIQNIVQQLQHAPAGQLIERIINHLPGTLFFRFAKTCFPAAATELDSISAFLSHLLDGGVNKPNYQQLLQPFYRYWLSNSLSNVEPPSIPALLEILYTAIKTDHPEILRAAKKEELLVSQDGKNYIAATWWQLVMHKDETVQKLSAGIPQHSKKKDGADHQPAASALNKQAKVADKPQFPKIGEMQDPDRQNMQMKGKAHTQEKEKQKQKNKKSGHSSYLQTTEKPIINKTPTRRNANMEKELKEGVFIENAGVIIVAAFLPALFAKLKLVQHGKLTKPDTAVMLVQYIVTGKSRITEPELVLPKILCGLEPEFPINTNRKITATQKREALSLLSSIIEHWNVLKNTSVQGLRESFLQRGGKMTLADNNWLLQVEQKSFDMLLHQLPWNISMIKLPWMNNLLKTEWI